MTTAAEGENKMMQGEDKKLNDIQSFVPAFPKLQNLKAPPLPDASAGGGAASVSDHVNMFSDDILMQGVLQKRGKNGLQFWKQRYFILRGRILYYYKMSNDKKCGMMKGQMDLKGAKARVVDSNITGLEFCIENINPDSEELNSREFLAADVQMLSDWVTAINTASCAEITEPIAHLNVVDQMRTTHVILIRHGQYNHVAGNVPDSYKTLTGLGQEQADLTGKFLAQYLADRMVNDRFPAVTIYHSDLTRAKQTAQCIAKHFTSPEMLENVLLREAWPCAPLPTSNKVVAAEKQQVMVADTSRLKVAFRTFFKHVNPKDLRRPSVQLTDDKVSTFNKNFDPKSTSVRIGDRYRIIVCHANIIRWFVCKSLGVDAEGTWGRMRYNHCGLTEIDVDALGNLQLGFFNQAAHLPSHMCTET